MDQEEYLKTTNMHDIIWRGIKKVCVEITSLKSLFLGFICLAVWFDKISDLYGIIGGIAVLGVKELPSEVFTMIIEKFSGGGK